MKLTNLCHRPWLHSLRIAAFVYLTATIVVMASERAYWYWTGYTLDSVFGLALAYVLPIAVALWSLALTHARAIHHVILGGALFGFIVEGVLTPVIYGDGALPVFAAMFVGWHGVVALVGFWYLTRRWLVGRQTRVLASLAAFAGLFWGAWARATAVGDELDAAGLAEGFDPTILSSGDFALYALAVGVTLAAAHWLLQYVWPHQWQPSRKSTRAVAIVAIGYMALAVIPIVIWAPLKLAVLLGATWWLMRRDMDPAAPTIFAQLAGPVRLRDAAILLILPAAAAISYAALDAAALADSTLVAIYWTLVMAQVFGGAAAYIVAARRALRRPNQFDDAALVRSDAPA